MREMTAVKYQKGEIIIKQGERAKALYRIMSGHIGLCINQGKPNEYMLGTLTAPHCFGEMCILTDAPCQCTIIALDEAVVLCVPEYAFEAFIRKNHQNATMIMNSMARKLNMMNGHINMLIDCFADRNSGSGNGEDGFISEIEEMTVQEADEETGQDMDDMPPEIQTADPNLYLPGYLPGHQGYPGVTHPEYKQYLFPKEYTCPHCGNVFPDVRIFYPKLVPEQMSEHKIGCDVTMRYRDFEVEWYEIVTCPQCYFSAPSNFFLEHRMLRKARFEQQLIQMRASMWLDFEAERSLDFVFAQHYLALVCSYGFSDFRQINARVWKNLSRLYRSVNESALERLAKDNALETYQSVYSHCQLKPAQEQRVCLIIADMLYKDDQLRKAQEWAMKARINKFGKRAYAEAAEWFITDVRAELAGK